VPLGEKISLEWEHQSGVSSSGCWSVFLWHGLMWFWSVTVCVVQRVCMSYVCRRTHDSVCCVFCTVLYTVLYSVLYILYCVPWCTIYCVLFVCMCSCMCLRVLHTLAYLWQRLVFVHPHRRLHPHSVLLFHSSRLLSLQFDRSLINSHYIDP